MQSFPNNDISEIMNLEGNNKCIDCSADNPTYASTNNAVFLCENCANIHKNLGSNIVWSVFAVDRMQGGTETLSNDGVKVYSLLQIDESLFQKAFSLGIINNEQLNVLKSFKEDPDGTMKNFLITHPEFLENSLNSDNEKTKKRAKLLVEQNIYGLNS